VSVGLAGQLWSGHTALYRAVVEVLVAGLVVDRVEAFGIRKIEIDAEGLRRTSLTR
jgi:beta-galactosidase/beta-glucuronidase